MAEPADVEIQVPITWVIPDEMPALAANQFLGQASGPGEIVLTVGFVQPPAILGATEEDRRAQAEKITFVPVQAVARLVMNRARLEQFRDVLSQTLANHDRLFRGPEGPAS